MVVSSENFGSSPPYAVMADIGPGSGLSNENAFSYSPGRQTVPIGILNMFIILESNLGHV